jgi:hypothetical protein
MMDRKTADEIILEALGCVKGITNAVLLPDEDRHRILDVEEQAEQKSLMGLGKVINAGVREVLRCDRIYVALTSMDFDWGCRPNLLMKKGDEVVGEEVSDAQTISRLSQESNVWFMHKNFVVYKDRVCFPQDVMQKSCHFEIPCHPAEWCVLEEGPAACYELIYAWPSTPCDVFLKQEYFEGVDARGSGTVLVGANLG